MVDVNGTVLTTSQLWHGKAPVKDDQGSALIEFIQFSLPVPRAHRDFNCLQAVEILTIIT